MAYDIVKAHGGELKVETSEGEGSEFIIQLPLNPINDKKFAYAVFLCLDLSTSFRKSGD